MNHTGLLSTAQIWTKLFQGNGIDAMHLWRAEEGWGLKMAQCWHPGNSGDWRGLRSA